MEYITQIHRTPHLHIRLSKIKKSAKRNGEKRKIAWLHTGTLALLIISLFCFSYMFFVEKFLLEVLFALLAAGGFYLVILLFELSRRE